MFPRQIRITAESPPRFFVELNVFLTNSDPESEVHPVLTKAHLAVLRAALQYFDDEMGPHGMDVMWPYFDEEPTQEWTSPEIRELQAYLRDCELRYATYSPAADQLSGITLSLAAGAVLSSAADPNHQVVTVVLPPRG